jgi:hypothetical protein
MAPGVITVRAVFDAGSVKLRVRVPTAATPPSVVRANRWIANEPVTAGAIGASTAAVGVAGDAVPRVPVTGTMRRPVG